jgi:hypothetical protein
MEKPQNNPFLYSGVYNTSLPPNIIMHTKKYYLFPSQK